MKLMLETETTNIMLLKSFQILGGKLFSKKTQVVALDEVGSLFKQWEYLEFPKSIGNKYL